MAIARPFTVLLVEDDPADQLLFTDLLEEVAPDVQVSHVENGLEALRYLQRQAPYLDAQTPSLVVLDLNMPVMNGQEFLRQVKQIPSIKGIPVLVLSTSDRNEDIRQSYEGHAVGYIVKPGNYKEYTEVLSLVKSYWTGAVRLPTLEEAATRLP